MLRTEWKMADDSQFSERRRRIIPNAIEPGTGSMRSIGIPDHFINNIRYKRWGQVRGIKESLGINHLEIREGDENPHLEAKVQCPDDTQ